MEIDVALTISRELQQFTPAEDLILNLVSVKGKRVGLNLLALTAGSHYRNSIHVSGVSPDLLV